jgi:hypothetical protein
LARSVRRTASSTRIGIDWIEFAGLCGVRDAYTRISADRYGGLARLSTQLVVWDRNTPRAHDGRLAHSTTRSAHSEPSAV